MEGQKANEKNFCGGAFSDWMEVMLTEKCNGRCSWCVDKKGYHPKYHASAKCLVEKILAADKKNIILLGGEPTLYEELAYLIGAIRQDRNVYVTTNGSRLTPRFAADVLTGLTGLNISIHDNNLAENHRITGIRLDERNLIAAIERIQEANIRLNCNLIRGHIDSDDRIRDYVEFAKRLGAQSIRFAELKGDIEQFVDLTSIYGNRFGINNNPFGLGCQHDAELYGMAVNFRQMCGFQISCRPRPSNPESSGRKKVLYYDGRIYDGWQMEDERIEIMRTDHAKEIAILEAYKKSVLTADEALIKLGIAERKPSPETHAGNCQY